MPRRDALPVRLGFLLAVGCLPGTASAQDATRDLPVVNGAVTREQWERLPSDPALAACTNEPCKILRALLTSYEALDRRDFPNSMARTHDRSRSEEVLPVKTLLRGNPAWRPEVCRQLATIARANVDYSVGLHTVELATLSDGGDGRCVTGVVSAFSRAEETDTLLQQARQLCETRHEPACASIAEPSRD